uniref:Uncharacterized protein n=1 Tax=Rhizophora mucronata TaxID=61149 RepID=A0A2P2NZX8_RHIMU
MHTRSTAENQERKKNLEHSQKVKGH